MHGTLHALGLEHPEGDGRTRLGDVAAPGEVRGGARMMAMLQLFIAPLLAALLTLWAARLAFAAESDADLPRALGGEFDTEQSGADALPPAACRASLAARPGGRRGRRRGGLVGLVSRAQPLPSRPCHRAGVGGGRSPPSPARRRRARADRPGAPRRRLHARTLPAAAPIGRLGRLADSVRPGPAAPVRRRRRRAGHAARRLFAGRHDGGGGHDAADRHRRAWTRPPTARKSARHASELRARPAFRLRRPSRCDCRRDLRQGHPGGRRRPTPRPGRR